MASIKIPNKELNCIVVHRNSGLIAAVGRRSSVVLTVDNDIEMRVLQNHLDEDKNENLTCAAFYDAEEIIYLATSGASGIIKIVNVSEYCFDGFLRGHGGSVTDLKAHTRDGKIIFSASEDTTVRMWNSRSKKCLAIFGGFVGHKDYVLSIDVSICGKRLVSSGTDCTIKLWNIPVPHDECLVSVYIPIYSSSRIHKSYIGCVRFYGELIVSKSLGSRIVVVYPDISTEIYNHRINSDSMFIDEYRLSESTQIPGTLSVHLHKMIVFVPSLPGVILLFDLKGLGSAFIPHIVNVEKKTIRDVVIDKDRLFVLYDDNEIAMHSLLSTTK
eukprot:jgi/Antlo1/1858/2297